jgi:hypothetical protein
MRVRPREGADQAAAEAFLTRHYSLRAARLGELVHPLDHPALVAETADGQLLGMLTYVPGRDWQQCEILTLHADEQWRGAGTALVRVRRGAVDRSRASLKPEIPAVGAYGIPLRDEIELERAP